MHEVNLIAVLFNPNKGILLTDLEGRGWAFAGSEDLIEGEEYEETIRRGLVNAVGISDITVHSVLEMKSFLKSTVSQNAKFGVFVLCSTQETDVSLDNGYKDFIWIKDQDQLDRLNLFHPLVKELANKALKTKITGQIGGGNRA